MSKYRRRRSSRKFATPTSSEQLPKQQDARVIHVHPNSTAARKWGMKPWQLDSDSLTDSDKRRMPGATVPKKKASDRRL